MGYVFPDHPDYERLVDALELLELTATDLIIGVGLYRHDADEVLDQLMRAGKVTAADVEQAAFLVYERS